MESILEFGSRKPLIFVVILLTAWIIAGSIVAIIAGTLFSTSIADPKIQAVSTLIATILLLFGSYRAGWIDKIGIIQFGSLASWLITLGVAIYLLLVDFYAFFGDISFQIGSFISQDALNIHLQAFRAGFVEEVVFRGVILYSLVRVWGKTNQGLIAALIVQAVLFALPHAFQVLVDVAPASVLSNVLATFIFGLWIGALVLSAGSLWPAIVLHTVSNSFILIKGLSNLWITPYYIGYLRSSLFELPLVLLGIWILFRRKTDMQQAQEST